MSDTTVMRAEDFLNTLGVNTHIPYTDGGYANINNVASDLAYLGIDNVRDLITDGSNGSAPLSSYISLAQQGVKFTILLSTGGNLTTADLDSQLSLVQQLIAAVPGSVTAVEGTNEINNFPITYNGVSGLAGAEALQQDIYSAVKGNPAFAGVSVDYFTGYGAGGIGEGPDPATTPGLADFDTQHPYPNNGDAPEQWVNPAQALSNETAPYGPAVYTETGYSSNGGTSGDVNEDVQAKYTLDLLMDDAANGISQTYLYDLLDAYAPGSAQGDDGYGLFDYTNAPKEVATAIHDLTTILADNGANASTFTPTPLNYTLTNLPSTGNSLELQKSDGATDIVVWAEPQIWNELTGTEITAPTVNTTVNLGATYGTVEVFDPLQGTTPIETLTNVSSVTLGLTDHPLIVEVEPGTGTTTTTSSTGSDPSGTSSTSGGSTGSTTGSSGSDPSGTSSTSGAGTGSDPSGTSSTSGAGTGSDPSGTSSTTGSSGSDPSGTSSVSGGSTGSTTGSSGSDPSGTSSTSGGSTGSTTGSSGSDPSGTSSTSGGSTGSTTGSSGSDPSGTSSVSGGSTGSTTGSSSSDPSGADTVTAPSFTFPGGAPGMATGAQNAYGSHFGRGHGFAATSGNSVPAASGSGAGLVIDSGSNHSVSGGYTGVLDTTSGDQLNVSGNVTAFLQNATAVTTGGGSAMVYAAGADTVSTGSGAATVAAGAGAVVAKSGSGSLDFIGGTGAVSVQGGSGDTSLTGGIGSANSVLVGGGGDNTLHGGTGTGATTLVGGHNVTEFAGGTGSTEMVAGTGNSTMNGLTGTGTETMFTAGGSALMALNGAADTVVGGSGASTVVGGSSSDVYAFLNGHAGGNEVILGLKGTDVLAFGGYNTDPISAESVMNGSDHIALSDGTSIVLAGIDHKIFS